MLIAVLNNRADWHRVQDEGWYRLPVKTAPEGSPYFDWVAFYFTKTFGPDKWAVHYYAPVRGHELLTRRDLIPAEPDHKRAGAWYYQLQLGPVQHKIPPIEAKRWKRITFIVTTGDRFEAATTLADLRRNFDARGWPFVTLREQRPRY